MKFACVRNARTAPGRAATSAGYRVRTSEGVSAEIEANAAGVVEFHAFTVQVAQDAIEVGRHGIGRLVAAGLPQHLGRGKNVRAIHPRTARARRPRRCPRRVPEAAHRGLAMVAGYGDDLIQHAALDGA